MSANQSKRRLAAIMLADVAGFSLLMGRDEAGTLSTLKSLRQAIFAPAIAKHHGRIVKLMGDGALVEFSSVVDAVTSAIEIQQELAEDNAKAEKKLVFSLGSASILAILS